MKKFIPLILVFALSISAFAISTSDDDNKVPEKFQKGCVKIIKTQSNADALIYISPTVTDADITIRKVEHTPQNNGEWQFVDMGEDFTVCIIETWTNSDFTVYFLN